MDNAKEDEELRLAIAVMSDAEKMEFWKGMFDTDLELAARLFFGSLLQDADADYKHQPKAPVFMPRQPPSANKTSAGSPPVTEFSGVTVLALCASGAPRLAGGAPNIKAPSTTAAARASQGKKPQCTPVAAQGKKPQCTPITPRHGAQDHTHAHPLVQNPRKPPSLTSEPGQAPPQNSYKTFTVLCAPPHLAGGLKRPSASTECTPQGKKQHLAV